MKPSKEDISALLKGVAHPETGSDIVSGGFVDEISADEEKITVSLRFRKARDPFAAKIRDRVEQILAERWPEARITVFIREGEGNKAKDAIERMHEKTTTRGIGKIIAVASGKGGVGKSTVTANLAVSLRNAGYRVGVLDADIYGPSQAKMFGCEDYVPDAVSENGTDYIIPAEVAGGIKLISIAMFIRPTDALLWRGTLANSALRQLIHQTRWGDIDFLLVDLPPGTGDIHLSIIQELHIDGAVIVSTPQQIAVADVVRGVDPCSLVAPAGTWRMPSAEEWEDLLAKTVADNATKSLQYGDLTIYLTPAGMWTTKVMSATSTYAWTTTPHDSKENMYKYLMWMSSGPKIGTGTSQDNAMMVRCVRNK